MIRIEGYKAGTFIKHIDYKAFRPNLIHQMYGWDDADLTRLAEEAAVCLGRLDAYADLLPDINHFIRLYVAKEATLSSKIEGTQTIIDQVFLAEKDIDPEKRDDWKEVNNYITAMNHALNSLDKLPLSSRLLRQAHKDLMHGVRGENKSPGEFRRSQNWIGGHTIAQSSFVPPLWNDLQDLMSDLEKFLHASDTGLTEVMKIGLAHYQFETIHPFLDGNGRVGRLLITLYLVERKMLHKPVLYLSEFIERNRAHYYDHLTNVRTKDDLTTWLKFFMQGVIETAKSSIQSMRDVLALKKDCEEKRLYKLGKKITTSKALLDFLFHHPIVDAAQVSKATGLSLVSAYKLIRDFIQLEILKERTGYKRNQLFVFREYLDIFR